MTRRSKPVARRSYVGRIVSTTLSDPAATRRLRAARFVGAAAIAVLGQLAVDMPEGYFGAGLDSTLLGYLFSATVVLAAVVAAALELAGYRFGLGLGRMTLVMIIGAFVWPLASDPVVAGAVIGWTLYLFGRLFFDHEAIPATRAAVPEAAVEWLHRNGPALRHLLLVSLFASTSALGYGFERRTAAFATCAALAIVTIASASKLLILSLRGRDRVAILATLLVLAGLATLPTPEVGLALLLLAQIVLLALIARHALLIEDLLDGLYDRPAALVTTSFVALILIGALLLSFPAASTNARSIGVTDALFTATSAACVTGLIVLDTPSDFSTFGQVVIIVLVQIGGLNIMVLSTFAALLLGRGLGLRGERAIGSVLDIETPGAAYRLITFIVQVTLALELVGAVGMTFAFLAHDYAMGRAVWQGVFHAISAFCNAGFSLQSDSLVMFRQDPLPLLLMASLITLGGIGFAVLAFLWRRLQTREVGRLALQSRIVIYASLGLVVVGTIAYLAGEWNATLAGLSLRDKVTNALFQSVTLRTAGFNSVGLEGMRPVTALWMLVFMFIGASPGGTGGGIKTTTAVVLIASIPALLRRRGQVVVRDRAISFGTFYQSAAIAVISWSIVMGAAVLLMASQTARFEQLLFEAFSAFGTVGLSLGATSQLDVFGKAITMVTMLVGRVGPLSIALLLARDYRSQLMYPEARIMVG